MHVHVSSGALFPRALFTLGLHVFWRVAARPLVVTGAHTLLFFYSSAVSSPHLPFSSSSSSSTSSSSSSSSRVFGQGAGLALQDDVLFPSLFTSL